MNIEIQNAGTLLPNEQQEYAETIAQWTREAAGRGEAVLVQKAERLLEQFIHNYSLVALACSHIVGHITGYPLIPEWSEIGTLIVPPEYRGKKIGHALAHEMYTHLPHEYLVATSKDIRAITALHSAGFGIWSYDQIPKEVRVPLCYEAPCYNEFAPGSCASEHNHKGHCFALARAPL